MKTRIFLLSALCGLVLGLIGTPAATAACTALVGGQVHLPSGPVEGATVVIVDERIVAAGPGAAVPAGCAQVDATGRVITAGLVEVVTQMGLVEVSLESATVDAAAPGTETPTPSVRASFVVADGYNPRSTLIPITRVAGVTSALTQPAGGLVAGRSAWVDLAGSTQAVAVRQPSVALHASVGGSDKDARAHQLHRLRQLLTEAAEFSRRESLWQNNRTQAFTFPVAELRALRPVLKRELPMVLSTDRASDIEAALRLAADFNLRLVIQGGGEAWLVRDALAAAKVPVIVDPMLNGPESFDEVHARADNARLLAEAGVPLILSAMSTHNARTLPQVAGNAVRAGLDHAAALVAVTRTPAEVFGMRDHGRLAPGARANVVLWSGDPFELSSAPERVWIGGRDIPLISRQTLLRDRYRRLPGTPSPPLSLP